MTAFRVDETRHAMHDALIEAGYILESLVGLGIVEREDARLAVRKIDKARDEWARACDDFTAEAQQ